MPRPTSWMSCVFPSLEHSTRRVRNLQTILGLTCSTYRAKPMVELASALFSIADVNEFRFARFYIVYEEARLVLLGSPSIVCELPDTPRGLSKRGKTQHSMPDAARKNYLDFTPKNPPLPVTLERYGSLIFLSTTYLLLQSPPPLKRVARNAGYNPLVPDSVSRRPRLSLRSSHYCT